MHDIPMETMSDEFMECWNFAGQHLEQQRGRKSIEEWAWLRAHPYPPILEHFSFRLWNQLFFIRVVDVDEAVHGPGNVNGLLSVAEGNLGQACLLPMKKKFLGGGWEPFYGDWGLVDASTNRQIDPVALITEELIEMTEWECLDFGVQLVRDSLQKQGYQLMSWQSNPEVSPSIWFIGESKKPEWVVVRVVKYPKNEATRPENWDAIEDQCAPLSKIGHFASVALVSTKQPFQSSIEEPVPLWRGHPNYARYTGLE